VGFFLPPLLATLTCPVPLLAAVAIDIVAFGAARGIAAIPGWAPVGAPFTAPSSLALVTARGTAARIARGQLLLSRALLLGDGARKEAAGVEQYVLVRGD
jgi:hypothetical protein